MGQHWCFSQVCVGTKKKAIHIVMITEDNVYPTKDISLSESPVHLVRPKSFQNDNQV